MTVRFRCDFRAFLLVTAGTASLVMPWARAEARSIHIAAQPMARVLEALGRQTGQNIVFTPRQVAHIQVEAVNGNMTAAQAVRRVLALIPMSAFDHKGLYKYLDAYGIRSIRALRSNTKS
ncbi:hypothetical protein HNW77_03275 [Komagataeibacter sp. AV436]|uniref:Uncharacterized protein n=1 Tax=Komagataeibacter melomenusus TaxID=2766578 RepID=A0ABX2ABG4_9PROT|nr:STN domain-containing protein [Komagataeibacter melomenusus]MBV1829215.1 STN domain-containing protein [Komagataeibacter melomenusus]NPC65446.1 hypothetical protein [Komagataeibacter melomenusus]